jgi:hypothetical protein
MTKNYAIKETAYSMLPAPIHNAGDKGLDYISDLISRTEQRVLNDRKPYCLNSPIIKELADFVKDNNNHDLDRKAWILVQKADLAVYRNKDLYFDKIENAMERLRKYISKHELTITPEKEERIAKKYFSLMRYVSDNREIIH